jgi:hypothetical protein
MCACVNYTLTGAILQSAQVVVGTRINKYILPPLSTTILHTLSISGMFSKCLSLIFSHTLLILNFKEGSVLREKKWFVTTGNSGPAVGKYVQQKST